MDPTEALFDSINRGDITAARDAVNRGADLNGQNVLGMTPIQLSIDLSRNDITFLLLASGAQGGAAPPAGTSSSVAKLLAGSPPPVKSAKSAARNTNRAVRTASTPAAPQTPRLFAGNGGTPIPNAGFLGFDTGR